MSAFFEPSTLLRSCALVLGMLLGAALARAADAPATQALRMFLERETTGLPGRVELEFGNLDPRASAAPCARVEPFLPSGARIWGRTSIGLRCSDGVTWSTFLPVTVHVFAPALVATRSLPAGQPLTEQDYRLEEIDLTLQPAGAIVQETAFVTGKELARSVVAGQPLRRDQFRLRPLVNPGDPVRLVYEGAGFTVSTDAKSLGSATDGQPVRVQTETGRVLTGIARGLRLVEIRP